MTQTISSKVNGNAIVGMGAHKIKAANKLMIGAKVAQRAADLKARNAYRVAIGLPPATS